MPYTRQALPPIRHPAPPRRGTPWPSRPAAHLIVRSGQQANGPVRTEQQPGGPETFQSRVEVWEQIPLVPAVPMGFGDQPGQLAAHMLLRRERGDAPGPLRRALMPDIRLAEVIQHERPQIVPPAEGNGGGQIFRVDQDLVDLAPPLERFHATVEPPIFQKRRRRRLILHLMAVSLEHDGRSPRLKPGIPDRRPADRSSPRPPESTDSTTPARAGSPSPASEARACTATEPPMCRMSSSNRSSRQEVPFQDGHIIADPAVCGRIEPPEMLMRVHAPYRTHRLPPSQAPAKQPCMGSRPRFMRRPPPTATASKKRELFPEERGPCGAPVLRKASLPPAFPPATATLRASRTGNHAARADRPWWSTARWRCRAPFRATGRPPPQWVPRQ